MIYFYSYLNHPIAKAQSFVNYIILEFICKANKAGMPGILDEHVVIGKYKPLLREVNSKYVKDPLNSAYQICKTLKKEELKVIKKALHSNIDIEGICNLSVKPILYSEIRKINKDLANYLYVFCRNLYEEVLKLAPFKNIFNEIDDHYIKFSIQNGLKKKRCPFCGTSRMLNEDNTKREAYDHYLPKERFPFSSINLKNLAPICHTCNSKYKLRKNPIDIGNSGIIRKTFYPFRDYGKLEVELDFTNINLSIINIDEINIAFVLNGYNEELESWNKLFSITERYKSIFSSDSFTWLEEVRIATNNFGETYQDYKKNLNSNYIYNENFLKIAVLKGSEKLGIIT